LRLTLDGRSVAGAGRVEVDARLERALDQPAVLGLDLSAREAALGTLELGRDGGLRSDGARADVTVTGEARGETLDFELDAVIRRWPGGGLDSRRGR
jgi:hypothetical protein